MVKTNEFTVTQDILEEIAELKWQLKNIRPGQPVIHGMKPFDPEKTRQRIEKLEAKLKV